MTRKPLPPKISVRLWALPLLAGPLMLSACGTSSSPDMVNDRGEREQPAEATAETGNMATPDTRPAADLPALIPPAPGEPGGLDDDRTPVAEGPIAPDSAQGAAQVMQRWGAFLEAGRYQQARQLWGDGGKASGMSAQQYRDAYAKYSEIHVLVGKPGDTEGAAGSIYVTVPVQMYGRMADTGKPFNLRGPVTLRRVNGVEGATPAQLRWHLTESDLKPMGTVREAQ